MVNFQNSNHHGLQKCRLRHKIMLVFHKYVKSESAWYRNQLNRLTKIRCMVKLYTRWLSELWMFRNKRSIKICHRKYSSCIRYEDPRQIGGLFPKGNCKINYHDKMKSSVGSQKMYNYWVVFEVVCMYVYCACHYKVHNLCVIICFTC